MIVIVLASACGTGSGSTTPSVVSTAGETVASPVETTIAGSATTTTDYVTSADGTITRLALTFISDSWIEKSGEVDAGDPEYRAALEECTRYPISIGDWGLEDVLADYPHTIEEYQVFEVGDEEYVVVVEELSYELDHDAAVRLGLVSASASISIDSFEVSWTASVESPGWTSSRLVREPPSRRPLIPIFLHCPSRPWSIRSALASESVDRSGPPIDRLRANHPNSHDYGCLSRVSCGNRSLEAHVSRKKTQKVLGLDMSYVEMGKGDPIVFLHGNPTSSYLWRDIMPYLKKHGRCIAPDLVGMGDSAKIPVSDAATYRFVQHRQYLDAFLEIAGVTENVTFVVHDWGSALGFDWATRHQDSTKGIAYMEAIVAPITWADWPEASRSVFQAMRSEAGEGMVLEKNFFVERILPSSIIRDLTEQEMGEYRRPFELPGEDRRPTLTWPREIPIEGQPRDVHDIAAGYAAHMAESDLPKLFINAEPGAILVGRQREICRTWPNQTEVTVPGIHFIQEDSADLIGEAIADWYQGL